VKFLVGREQLSSDETSASGAIAVFLVSGDFAVNLSATEASIGHDLRGLLGRDNLAAYLTTRRGNRGGDRGYRHLC